MSSQTPIEELLDATSGKFNFVMAFLLIFSNTLASLSYINLPFLIMKTHDSSCGHQNFTEIVFQNFYTKFKMECFGPVKISLPGTMLFTGWALGTILVARLSDKKGRKVVFLCTMGVNLVCQICVMALGDENFNFLVLIYFIFGVEIGGRNTTCYTYAQEILPKEHQVTAGIFFWCLVASANLGLVVFYKYIHANWIWVFIFSSSLILVQIIIIAHFIPESPRWLDSKQKYDKTLKVLSYLAKLNNKQVNLNVFSLKVDNSQNMNSKNEGYSKMDIKPQVLYDLIYQNPRNLGCMVFLFVSSSFAYFLISFEIQNLGGDFFLNGTISSISEICGYIFMGVLLKYSSLVPVFQFQYSLSFGSAIFLFFYNGSSVLYYAITLLILKLGISSVYALVFQAVVEIFDANIVGQVFGICLFCSKIMIIMIPFLTQYDQCAKLALIIMPIIGLIFSGLLQVK